MIFRFLIVIFFIILIEFLALRACLKYIRKDYKKKWFKRFYITAFVLFVIIILVYYFVNQSLELPDHIQFRNFFNISALLVISLAPKILISIFSIIDDIIQAIFFLFRLIYRNTNRHYSNAFRRIVLSIGFISSGILLFFILKGIVYDKTHIEVKHIEIASKKLPSSFNGFRIAHVSDFHLGSYRNTKAVEKGLKQIHELNPDIIVSTGDMVNNEAGETLMFLEIFKKLNPPLGMFSILGNHDMGDYRRWYNEREKTCNLKQLVRLQEEMGFSVLRNTHVFIRKDNDSIALAGIDNWGLPPFKQYGNLDMAVSGIDKNTFCILLSHDPSHWEAEVLNNHQIDLTLSGHTHGFQFVVTIGSIKLSPVQLKYKNWGGLYKNGTQYLNVNTGFGYIGFPGRIGVPPEITLITLKTKN